MISELKHDCRYFAHACSIVRASIVEASVVIIALAVPLWLNMLVSLWQPILVTCIFILSGNAGESVGLREAVKMVKITYKPDNLALIFGTCSDYEHDATHSLLYDLQMEAISNSDLKLVQVVHDKNLVGVEDNDVAILMSCGDMLEMEATVTSLKHRVGG